MNKDVRNLNYFMFSQNSLRTFDECPYKFKKRYIDNLKWNNLPSTSARHMIEQGRDFHLIAQRYFNGIMSNDEKIDGELGIWYRSLLKHFPLIESNIYLPEYKLRMFYNDIRLEANYDLVVITPQNKIEIWDWKTHYGCIDKHINKTIQDSLMDSYQTAVYMFVLKQQIKMLLGNDIDCNNISMTYWCPYPAQIIYKLPYSDKLHQQYKIKLGETINKILSFDYDNFSKQIDSSHCPKCEFNLLCNNTKPDFSNIDDTVQIIDELDLDHVEEIF